MKGMKRVRCTFNLINGLLMVKIQIYYSPEKKVPHLHHSKTNDETVALSISCSVGYDACKYFA